MNASRRLFLQWSSAYAAGFAGVQRLLAATGDNQASAGALGAERGASLSVAGFGPLVSDPQGVIDLPSGFSYQVISTRGDEMADGLLVPGAPDGMACFPGPDGKTLILRNHELEPTGPGPFGDKLERLGKIDNTLLYDTGSGRWPGAGGVTTLVYDTKAQKLEKQFLSLGGTIRNCAGGTTPWGSWITCEETTARRGGGLLREYFCDEDHGYAFEVQASAEVKLQKAEPLRAMGRFYREAIAIDPASGAVYQTEDLRDGLLYRFLPNTPGKLAQGGRLQALAVRGSRSFDTRNYDAARVAVGQKLQVEWIDVTDPVSLTNELRYTGYDAGAARFGRGEGMWYSRGAIYFACTEGGRTGEGQVWRYSPSPAEGTPAEGSDPAVLELFAEPNDARLVKNCDNLTVSPWGDLIVCEDRDGDEVRLVGVTPAGGFYTFAHNHKNTEFAGVCFSIDGTTLFVNLQHSGQTLAITGPWNKAAV